MRRVFSIAFIFLSSLAFAAAEIDEVIVRQQWPASRIVKVDFRVRGVENPVDVTVRAYAGATEIGTDTLAAALKGDVSALGNGSHEFWFDPAEAFPGAAFNPDSFRLSLALKESSPEDLELLYRIFDLETGRHTDLRRGDFATGQYGTYETDFSAIDPTYRTSLTKVFIWTGVTNYPGAKTTKLIFRYIPAKGAVYSAGAVPDTGDNGFNTSYVGNPTVKLTKDFWIGVFEVTEKQYSLLTAAGGVPGTIPAVIGDEYAAGKLCYKTLRGDPTEWGGGYPADPNTVTPTSMIQLMRDNLGAKVDLPAEYQWEYAARAGTETHTYIGYGTGNNAKALEEKIAWNSDFVKSRQVVGLLRPNAYGLYDILGNVNELCRDRMAGDGESITVYSGEITDPEGPTDISYASAMMRGGGYNRATTDTSVMRRRLIPTIKNNSLEYVGMRLWMPAD